MPSIPGLRADVYFGDAEKPLPDWRTALPDDDNEEGDDALSADDLNAVNGMLGFDSAELDGTATMADPMTSARTSSQTPAKTKIAGAHADAARAQQLLKAAEQQGATALAALSRKALARLCASPQPLQATQFFDRSELNSLREMMTRFTATANLLGRSRVRLLQEKVQKHADAQGDFASFAEEQAFDKFDDQSNLAPMAPTLAISYFRGLTPALKVNTPEFLQSIGKTVFTAAAATDQRMLERMKDVIQSRLETGQGISSAPRALNEIMAEAGVGVSNPQYSEMVVRTNMMSSYNDGAQQEMRDPDLEGLFPCWLYMGIADGRQGEDHSPHFGKYFANAVDFKDVRNSLVVKNGEVVDAGPGEGRPYNCILPDVPISGKVQAGSKAWYTGQAVKIHTASGARLSVTLNHPVLSIEGFAPAGQFKEGDQLLHYVRERQSIPSAFVSALRANKENAPAAAEKVFRALNAVPGAVLARFYAPSAALNFHGDAVRFKGQVEIVRADGMLPGDIEANAGKSVRELLLEAADVDHATLPGDGSLSLDFRRIDLATPRVMSGPNLSAPLTASHAGPFEPLRFGLAAQLNTTLAEPAGERPAADAAFVRQLLQGFPGQVATDKIVKIEHFHYDGPVYDFESPHGWILGSGIFISNCRCTFLPISKYEAKAKGIKVEKW